MKNHAGAEETDKSVEVDGENHPCPYCGTEQREPREPLFGGGVSGRHHCYCVWEDQPNGPMVLLATGVCCYRTAGLTITAHHRSARRWGRFKAPRPVDWDEASACAASTRPVAGDLWQQNGWPEASRDHARLLSVAHRAEHWPKGPSEGFFDGKHREQMVATVDEVAEWLMLARDRIAHSNSILQGSADVHAAGELLARLADALAAWETWRAERVVEDAARARRVLVAASYRWGASEFMFRHFVAEHLDASLARRLDAKQIAVLACAIHLKRRGRPRKQADPVARDFKQDAGLDPDEEVPDKIEALQRLAASIGIPRLSPDAVEDQVQPLLARLAEIRRERDDELASLQKQDFDSSGAFRAAFEDADIYASVMEDEAIRTCGTRKKPPSSSSRRKRLPSVAAKKSRRAR